jgi:hypothetical protein
VLSWERRPFRSILSGYVTPGRLNEVAAAEFVRDDVSQRSQ